jgi:hypothetical protein
MPRDSSMAQTNRQRNIWPANQSSFSRKLLTTQLLLLCGAMVFTHCRNFNWPAEISEVKTDVPTLPQMAAPSMAPAGGLYISTQNVTITTTPAADAICYSTDGVTTPACSGTTCTSGSSYSAAVSVSANQNLQAIACASGYTASAVASETYTFDLVPPTVFSSTPADAMTNVAPCSGAPCRAAIVLVFSESMNTTLTQTLTTEIFDGASYVSAPDSSPTYTWSTGTFTNDTLTIQVGWYWFPEFSQIRYTLPIAGFQDLAGNFIAAQVQRSFTTTKANQAYPLADTGYTSCHNDAGVTACGDPSWPGQDGDFLNVPAARSFIGPSMHATYNSDFTTVDNVTGLTWKACSEGRSGATCAVGANGTYTWANAISQCSALNAANSGAGYAGINEWRLPTMQEIETLLRFWGSPAVEAVHFPQTAGAAYWSSTARFSSPTNAWRANFSFDPVYYSLKTTAGNIRCVASSTSASRVFSDNGDGTITDNSTNLRWQKCARGKANDATCSGAATTGVWSTALNYCDTLNLGSFGNSNNWRLPNPVELNSLINRSVIAPMVQPAFFPGTTVGDYWTSMPYSTPTGAWSLSFSTGYTAGYAKTNPFYTRCVATGP